MLDHTIVPTSVNINVIANTELSIGNGIIYAHLNICSIYSKTLSLYQLLLNFHIDIISINETWLNYAIPNNSLFLPGYKIHGIDRQLKVVEL